MSGQEDEPGSRPASESEPPATESRPASGEGVRGWYALMGIGLEFTAVMCVTCLLGWWLDGRWQTFPWLTIAGAAIGFAAGLTIMINAAKRAFRQ